MLVLRIEERDVLEQLVEQAMTCRTFLTKIVNFSLAYFDKDLSVVSEKLTTAVKAIEVAVLYDHQANRNLELALARYSGRFKVNRLLGGLQKPKIQQIQQHLKEVATDSGALSLDKVFEFIMEGENLPSCLEKEIKSVLSHGVTMNFSEMFCFIFRPFRDLIIQL